jgi:hypothetical protein
MSRRAIACAALCAAGCSGGTTGTVTVELTTAPDSHVLDAVQTLRLTVTDPHQVIEAARGSSGFDLALDLDASGVNGAVIVEGLDASGALIACGQSPGFPIAAINAQVTVYMAPPRSIAFAPASLDTARSQLAGASLGYGVALAGGLDGSGAPSSSIAIYNAYNHTLISGIALPAPRANLAAAADSTGGVYLFGGTGADGSPTGTLWRFDTTVAPNGQYTEITDQAALARTGQLLVPISTGEFLATGSPALTVDATGATQRSDIDELPAAAATAVRADGSIAAIFADTQLVRFSGNAFDVLAAPGRTAATAASLPDGRIVVVGGGDPLSRDLLAIDPTTGAVTTVSDALVTPRSRPSVAATSRHLVVAGGSDATGAPIATAEILDVQTLAPIATLPIVARTGAYAVALPTDQVMIAGGAPASAQIELFTPEPPP